MKTEKNLGWIGLLSFFTILYSQFTIPLRAQTRSAVMVSNATGQLAGPTNFFAANSNLLNQAVNASGFGGGGGGAPGFDPCWFFTNAAGKIDLALSISNFLNAAQTGSVNLTNWSALATNILTTMGATWTNAIAAGTNALNAGQYLAANGGTGNANTFTGAPLFQGAGGMGPGLAATFYSAGTVTTAAISNHTGTGAVLAFDNDAASTGEIPFNYAGSQYWIVWATSNLWQIKDVNAQTVATFSNLNDSLVLGGNLYSPSNAAFGGSLAMNGSASLLGALTESNRYSYHTNATVVEPEILLGGAGSFYEAFEFGALWSWQRQVQSNTWSVNDLNNQHVIDLTNLTDSIGLHGNVNVDSNLTVAGAVSITGNVSAANFGTAGQSNGLQFLGALGGQGSNDVLYAPITTNLHERTNLTVDGSASLGNGKFIVNTAGNSTNAGTMAIQGNFTASGGVNIITHPMNGTEKLDINSASLSDTDALAVMSGNNAYNFNYPAAVGPEFQVQPGGGVNEAFVYYNITNANGNLALADNLFSAPTWNTIIQTAGGSTTLTLPTSTNWSMSIYSGNAGSHASSLFGSNTCLFDVLNDGGGIETVVTADHAFFHILTNGAYVAVTNPSISPGQYMRLCYGGSNGIAILNLANSYPMTSASQLTSGTVPDAAMRSSGSYGDNESNYVHSVTLPGGDFLPATNANLSLATNLVGSGFGTLTNGPVSQATNFTAIFGSNIFQTIVLPNKDFYLSAVSFVGAAQYPQPLNLILTNNGSATVVHLWIPTNLMAFNTNWTVLGTNYEIALTNTTFGRVAHLSMLALAPDTTMHAIEWNLGVTLP